MKNPLHPAPATADAMARARNAFWLSGVISAVAGLALTFAAIEAEQNGTAFLIINNLMIAIMLGSGLLSMGLARAGAAQWAGLVLNMGTFVSLVGTVLISQGLGLSLGLGVVLLSISTNILTLPARLAPPLIAAGVLGGLVLVLLDLFGLENRPPSGLVGVLPYIVGGIAVVFVALLVQQFNRLSLRAKFIISFLGIAILPAILLITVNDFVTRQALTDSANNALLAQAKQAARGLDAFFAAQRNALRAEASLAELQEYLLLPENARAGSPEEQRAQALLTSLSRKELFISSYALLDTKGIDLIDTFVADVGLDKSDREYFRVTFQSGLPYVSPLEVSQTSFDLSLYFASPVRDSDGSIIGVLRVRYNASVIQQLTQDNSSAEAFMVVVDDNLIRLADGQQVTLQFTTLIPLPAAKVAELQLQRRLPSGTAEEIATDLPEFAAGLRNFNNSANFTAELHPTGGSTDAAAVTRLTEQPWFVVFAIPEAVFLAPAETQTRWNIILLFVAAVLVAIAALIVAEVLTGPIVRLTAVAERVRGGEITARASVESGDEIGALATSFNTMTRQLRETLAGLEQRVVDRTRALAASTEVSRRLSTILDQDQLVKEVVVQVQRAFNYYHAHIYLFDATQEFLVMRGGTGAAGATLLASGHKIPYGRGLVGRAADTNATVLVVDVTQAVGWLPNPLLPDTKAEIAVPISIGNDVLGVLDVQQDRINGLSQDDADLLQSIANQIAVALQNTRAYRQSQQKAQAEALINAIGQQIQSTTSVASALQVAVRELGRAVGAPGVQVRLKPSAPSTSEPNRN